MGHYDSSTKNDFEAALYVTRERERARESANRVPRRDDARNDVSRSSPA